MSSLTILHPHEMENTQNVDARALLFNFLLLYGFGALGQIIPNLGGVYRRGFFCDDESIMLGYKEDTVSVKLLIFYSIMINVVVVLAVEYYRTSRFESAIDQPKYRWRNSHIHLLFVRLITYIGYSQIGFICTLTVTSVTKNVIGRLRPHFLAVCQPLNTNCTGNLHHYVAEYTCSGDAARELEARKSFFSGHSSMAMYCSVWSALYLQARLVPACTNRIVVPMFQTIFISIGLVICFTRINDNMHHWSDVLIGILVGTFIAVYTCICWTDIYDVTSRSIESTPLIRSQYEVVDGSASPRGTPLSNVKSRTPDDDFEIDLEAGTSNL